MPELFKKIEDKKFMWDGRIYEAKEEAEKIKSDYEKDNFQVQIVFEDGKYLVYTRRVVKELIIEGQPI